MTSALFKPPFPRLQNGRLPAYKLVQAWPMYETSGQVVHDLGPHRQNGTMWSGAPKWAGDTDGACLHMQNETDYIEFGNGPTPLAGSTSASFSFWLRYDALPSAAGNRIMLQWRPGTGSSGPVQSWAILANNPGQLRLVIQNSGRYVDAYTSASVLAAGLRSHVCIVWAGQNTVLFYMDGVLYPASYNSQSLNAGDAIVPSTAPVALGYEAVESVNGFKGKISDVRFYGRALSAPEVRELFAGQA